MAAMLIPAILTGCKQSDSEKVIEKPQVEIQNGMLTPEVLEALGRIGEYAVSPDGKTVVFTLAYEDIQENRSNAEIYRMNIDGSDMKRLTTTAGSESNLQWIENGERIAFLGKDSDSGKIQIFSIDPNGSGRKRHSNVEEGVDCFVISPDGTKVIYASQIKDFNKNDENLFEGLPKTTGRLVDDLMYKHWDEWVTSIPHPFLADFSASSEISDAKDIMEGEPYECPMKPFGAAESFAWNPDSKSLVYVSRKLKGQDYAFSTNSDIYLYDLASGKTTNLTEGNPGYDTDPVFSPDGTRLAWLSMATAKFESDKKRLMVLNLSDKSKKDLTENWDYWPEGIAWDTDGKSIVFNG